MGKSLKEEIVDLFCKGLTYKEIKEELNCSKGTISYHCSSLRINKYSEDNIKMYQDYFNTIGDVSKTAKHFKICRRTLAKYIDRGGFIKVPKRKKLNIYYQKVKLLAVAYKGGKCNLCGYNKSIWALEFHHRDPKEKEFTISGGTKSFEKLKKELDKCDLLCSNCHSEEHERLDKIKWENYNENQQSSYLLLAKSISAQAE